MHKALTSGVDESPANRITIWSHQSVTLSCLIGQLALTDGGRPDYLHLKDKNGQRIV